MSGIPINSGTGPSVAAIASGTDYIQLVAIASGTVNISGTPTVTVSNATINAAISGSASIINTVTVTGTVGMLMLQRLDNSNDSILIYGAQTGSSANVPILVSTAGGLFIASGGGGGAQYGVDSTSMNATGTGTLILGMQTGATTGRGIAVTTTGAQIVSIIGTVPVSGTITTPFITTTASIAIIGTAHASRFQGYVAAITSAAAGTIVRTSGAHTLYITDVLVSVPTPMNVGLYSETTGPLAFVYLASNGGWAQSFTQPLICSSAQSLRVILSSSGSCSVSVIGFTVT